MIKSEIYGIGQRWYCTECDVLISEHGHPTIHWTNSQPPTKCDRCEEPAVMVCWDKGRPAFVSMVMTRREAVALQRIMQEGGVYDVERGRELKQQMLNRGHDDV